MAGKRALITGIDGFTGHYVKKTLEESGYTVYGTSVNEVDSPRCYKVDLLDKEALIALVEETQPNVVLHLAGIAFVGDGDPGDFYRVNLIGTSNLLEALANHAKKLDAVLVVSSANVYGNATEGMLAESSAPNPVNDYAVSKIAMEYMAKLWRQKLPLILVRPFNYTGVGQTENFLLPKIVAHFRQNQPQIELGNLDVWRDFNDVRVVAELYRRLIETKPIGQVVNICTGVTHSLREVIAVMEGISGHRIEIKVNPAFVRENEVKVLCGDPTHLRSLIGEWEPKAIEETLQWMFEHKHNAAC